MFKRGRERGAGCLRRESDSFTSMKRGFLGSRATWWMRVAGVFEPAAIARSLESANSQVAP
jgi:hypothetical protein